MAASTTDHVGPPANAPTKPDSMSAEIWTVRSLLKSPLRIPDYQRPYKWGTSNVEQLIDDILRFKPAGQYRIGTMVLHTPAHESRSHEQSDDPRDQARQGIPAEIVDGQQRFITFLLLAHHLLASQSVSGQRSKSDEELRSAIDGHNVSRNGLEVTSANMVDNFQLIQRKLGSWPESDRADFAEFLFDQCQVVVLTLSSADEAFQMFDSQNSRGRALYPTDLLKAFHIREMSSEHVSRELKMAMVRLWEDIPAESVDRLFSDHLFKIKSWANGRAVPDRGFTNADIDMFKGIRESDPANAHNKWAMPFLYAKNFTDDFGQENHTLIRYGALDPVEYPFQIDQPLINGENFFKMVAHYHHLATACGLFDSAGSQRAEQLADPLAQAVTSLNQFNADSRFTYVRNLIDCLLLYYVDRFGDQRLDRAVPLIVQHGLALRVSLKQVRRSSVNRYALGQSTGVVPAGTNLFGKLRESLRAGDFLSHKVRKPSDTDNYRQLEVFFDRPLPDWPQDGAAS